jgi:hypothetical protein
MAVFASVADDLVVGRVEGDFDGIEIPADLLDLPDARLRVSGGAIIDVAQVSSWHVDANGRKHMLPGEGRQAVSCAWGDRLILEAGAWRVRGPADDLKAYAANRRWLTEVGGIEVPGIGQVPTDDRAKMLIMGAAGTLSAEDTASYVSGNTSILLTGTQFRALHAAVVGHVQACFAMQTQVLAAIEAGTITSRAQIDAANWPPNT